MAQIIPQKAKTALHTKLMLQVESLDTIKQQLGSVGMTLDTRLQAQVQSLDTIKQQLGSVGISLGDIHAAILSTGTQEPGEPTSDAFDCIRALNQVEDLVTDRSFKLEANNKALRQRWSQDPTQECWKNLRADPALYNRFREIYRVFPKDGDIQAGRTQRYLELDRLRRDIVRHFARP